MAILEYLAGIFIAILTIPCILVAGLFALFDIGRFLRIRNM